MADYWKEWKRLAPSHKSWLPPLEPLSNSCGAGRGGGTLPPGSKLIQNIFSEHNLEPHRAHWILVLQWTTCVFPAKQSLAQCICSSTFPSRLCMPQKHIQRCLICFASTLIIPLKCNTMKEWSRCSHPWRRCRLFPVVEGQRHRDSDKCC